MKKNPAQAIYEKITKSLIEEMENGVAPWVMPWNENGATFLPSNITTENEYSGINIFLLWEAREAQAMTSNRWMTFKQGKTLGASVKKGEKGSQILVCKSNKKTIEEKNAETGEIEKKVTFFPMMKVFTVFNKDQFSDLPQEVIGAKNDNKEIPSISAFVKATGAEIKTCEGSACYRPSGDYISVPAIEDFHSENDYYATVLHELAHWTKAEDRLNRIYSNKYEAEQAYAIEELTAELTAAYLCSHLGIDGKLQHASYLKNWSQLLKDHPKAFLSAASNASKAADYLRNFSKNAEV